MFPAVRFNNAYQIRLFTALSVGEHAQLPVQQRLGRDRHVAAGVAAELLRHLGLRLGSARTTYFDI